jgi:predicted nucleotidyltransferase
MLTERSAAQLEARRAERSRVERALPEPARILAERFGARRVLVFGSLARAEGWDEHSDVDIAVEGVAPRRFFEAWALVERLVGRALDLVALEGAEESLRQRVVREGKVLHGAV